MKIKPIKTITQEYLDNLNNPETNKFLSTHGKPQTKTTVKKWIKDNKPYGVYVDNKLIGTIHISVIPVIGILVFKNYQRKGYGLEALKRVGQKKMLTGIDESNIASINLFEKAGFKPRKMWQL